jgi:hypothetical protein
MDRAGSTVTSIRFGFLNAMHVNRERMEFRKP